jgi:hypothetical protein
MIQILRPPPSVVIAALENKLKEILAENEKLKEINGKLSERLSWKLSDEPFYRVK